MLIVLVKEDEVLISIKAASINNTVINTRTAGKLVLVHQSNSV